MQEQAAHEPVLWGPVLSLLNFGEDAVVVDATVGHGGHARALAGRLGARGRLIALDVDDKALAIAAEALSAVSCRVDMIRANFGDLDKILEGLGIARADVILADLGINSGQLADEDFGLSFRLDGPLDMRLDNRLPTTAADLVNGLRAEELADIIFRYGEERRSRAIARTIVEVRREHRLERTGDLAAAVLQALGIKNKDHGFREKIHPATRTFQALRIAVNDELGQLENLLKALPRRLTTGGQAAIISFHSLEDRLVKYAFRDGKTSGFYEIMTKKPIVADEDERERNPRSRSAKLRVVRKTGDIAPAGA